MNPKVFVSHASEDKDRFVLKFAEQLRKNGIDAWLDKWEMLPGDSLVDKIFEEGIKDAKAVIIVLSKFSVEKPWVKEELNAAFVKRINNGSKLIPVIIDECEIPEVLKSTLWERINDLSSYAANLDRIIAAIFGVTDKPPLGSPPAYTRSFIQQIGGLNNLDSLVLRLSCDEHFKTGDSFINPAKIFLQNDKLIVPEGELKDSLEILDDQGYIKLLRTLGGGLFSYRITTYGFEAYAKAVIPNYEQKITAIVSAIVNENLHGNFAIQEKLNESLVLVNHVLNVLENNGHITLSKSLGGPIHIFKISPLLKRALAGQT